jgi:hypothetical protein
MAILENEVEIVGETVRKERFGMASVHDVCKTFTGYVLYTSEKYADTCSKSVEENFAGTAQVDGLTVWRSNGEVPFADMLLDFVQIGAITFEQAEFSLTQKNKDSSASLKTLYRAEDGNIYLGEDALGYREERIAKLNFIENNKDLIEFVAEGA